MPDHKNILTSLAIGANGGHAVTVRETNFGYVIRSEKVRHAADWRDRLVKFALVAVWIAVAGVWLMPLGGPAVALKILISLGLLGAAYLGLFLTRRNDSGYELHVDTSRRELRSAVLTAKGESWIRTSARFGEVITPMLRRGKPENDMRSLCLRIAGEDDVMPVAIGDETTLLAIHDRLMRDLRPIEERLPGYKLNATASPPRRGDVFPQLGPDEVSA